MTTMPEVLSRDGTRADEAVSRPGSHLRLLPETEESLAESDPSSHTYRVSAGRLVPRSKLVVRQRRIATLYPNPLTSLLDLSCSNGYYVLSAAQSSDCQRALGIDVDTDDLHAAEDVRNHLGLERARFEPLQLHELAERLDEFGGPFQTTLLIHSYQHLFFGHDQGLPIDGVPSHGGHREIFSALRRVCAGRVVFNNCTEIRDCQGYLQVRACRTGRAGDYNTAAIRAAAEDFFNVSVEGQLGRYPLWLLIPKRRAAAKRRAQAA